MGINTDVFEEYCYSDLVNTWNAKFDNDLCVKEESITTDGEVVEVSSCYPEITKNLTIAALDYHVAIYNSDGSFSVLYSDHVASGGATYERTTCDIDPNASVVGGGSAVYDGTSHEDAIMKSVRVKCKLGHGKDSGAGGKTLLEYWDISTSLYNTRTKRYWDTTSVGTINIAVLGIYGHKGDLAGTFTIKPFELTSKNIKLANTTYTYTVPRSSPP